MQIKNTVLAVLIASSPLTTFGTILTRSIPPITIKKIVDQEDGELLKTIPLPEDATKALTEGTLSLVYGTKFWDAGRSIYKTDIPGLGFSLCSSNGGHCITQESPWLPGEPLFLRVYKIGELKGGRFSLPTLTIIGTKNTLLRLSPQTFTVYASLCEMTSKRMQIKFPTAVLKPNITELISTNFRIPVKCQNPDDYKNIGIQFRFQGKLVDSHTLPTQLNNIGIQIINGEGVPIDFNSITSDTSSEFSYVAKLVTLPEKLAKYGKFSVDATAILTLR